jgi:drug/metabolite transporter (DMT)-like permease
VQGVCPLPSAQRVGIALAYGALCVIWGTTYLAIRYAIATLPPLLMAGTRFLLAGGILYAIARLRGNSRPTLPDWRFALTVGALVVVGAQGGIVWAEQTIPSGVTAVLAATVPMWFLLLEWLRPGGRRPSLGLIVGVLVGFAGVVVLVGPWHVDAGRVDPLGSGIVLVSALCFAVASLLMHKRLSSHSQTMATGSWMLCGSLLLLALASVHGDWGRLSLSHVSLVSALAWGYLVIVGSVLAFTIYFWLITAWAPAPASTYAYVNPMVAMALGFVVAGEPLTPRIVLAALVILGSVVLVTVGPLFGSTKSGTEAVVATAEATADRSTHV